MTNPATGTTPVETVALSKIDHECRTLRQMIQMDGPAKERD
uniref:Uncharacterized protein n=1 Tax=Candidatus Kentrum sp. FW TaxID=2126338 RepID=A0A450SPZ3_9GAMM|nr:MAG: hypothetical protein BECKFW1821B_GA0114236_102528 [Candidatus Kentron sp. FW]